MKKILLITIAVLTIGLGVYSLTGFAKDNAAVTKPTAPPVEVSVATIGMSKIAANESLPGRVTPFRQSEVRPQVEGIITQQMFEEGSNVEKGQQLYQIDDSRYKALFNSATADLRSAEAEVKSVQAKAARSESLIKINAVSQQEHEETVATYAKAKAGVAVAQAAIDLAKVNLDYTRVYAPISGRIGRSYVTEGALVSSNQQQALATITQLNPVYVDIQQSGSGIEIEQLRARLSGQDSIPVTLLVTGKSGTENYPHEGSLKFSEVTVDATASSVTLRALFENPEGKLLPGMFVRTVLHLGSSEAVVVPQRATTRTADGQLKVWIIDVDNKATQKTIKSDQAYEDQWVVTEGLKPGDRVIMEGYQKVRDGMIVSPVEAQAQNKTVQN